MITDTWLFTSVLKSADDGNEDKFTSERSIESGLSLQFCHWAIAMNKLRCGSCHVGWVL